MRLKRNHTNYFLRKAKSYNKHGFFISQGGYKYPKLKGWKKYIHK